MCDSAQLEENFFKNAVHVNDLEDHFRKLDHQSDSVPSQLANNKAYSTSTSTPLSPAALALSPVQSNDIKPAPEPTPSPSKPFVSCVSQLCNFKFIDNVDQNSFNYTSVIEYVYKCKLIFVIFLQLSNLFFFSLESMQRILNCWPTGTVPKKYKGLLLRFYYFFLCKVS